MKFLKPKSHSPYKKGDVELYMGDILYLIIGDKKLLRSAEDGISVLIYRSKIVQNSSWSVYRKAPR